MFFKEKIKGILKISTTLIFIFVIFIQILPEDTSASTDLVLKNGTTVTNVTNWTYGVYKKDGVTYTTNDYQKVIMSGVTTYDGGELNTTATNASTAIGECFTNEWEIIPKVDVGNCVARILYIVLWVISYLLGFIGLMFNTVFDKTVVGMSLLVEQIKVIQVGWTAIRDMANILFIFMLLYLAIATILQLDEHGVKHGLSRLIIGATLINFSLFFVKIPIDVSNILAIEIYNKIQTDGSSITGGKGGLGDAFLSMFSPQQAFADPNVAPDPSKPIWNFGSNPITTFVMGIIIMATACFVFLAVIIIFIKRFISLVMLMIFSPLAFAGMAVPNHNIEHDITSKFWGTLLKESFYAPVFMFMVYLTLTVGKALNVATTSVTGTTSTGASSLGYIDSTAVNVINYSVVLGMLIFSLTVSESMGVKGASGAIKFFDSARGATTGWVGANTIGRMAYTVLNKGNSATNLAKAAAGQSGGVFKTYGARAIQGVLKTTGKGFGEKVHVEEEYKKALDEELHQDSGARAARLMNAAGKSNFSADLQSSDKEHHHWNADEHANVKLALEGIITEQTNLAKTTKDSREKTEAEKKIEEANKALTRYYKPVTHGNETHYGRLTSEMYNKMTKAEYGELEHYNNEFRKIATSTHDPKHSTLTPAQFENEKIQKLKDFIKNAKSEVSIVGTIKNMGAAGSVFSNNSNGTKNKLQEALTESLRDKFSGEAAYASIAKDPTLSKDLRSSISAAGYISKMTADVYDALSSDKQDKDGKLAIDNQDVRDEFAKLLRKIDDEEIKTAVATGDIVKMMEAYEKNKLGEDRPTQNYFSKDNGKRSQTQSEEIITALKDTENLVKDYIKKDK